MSGLGGAPAREGDLRERGQRVGTHAREIGRHLHRGAGVARGGVEIAGERADRREVHPRSGLEPAVALEVKRALGLRLDGDRLLERSPVGQGHPEVVLRVGDDEAEAERASVGDHLAQRALGLGVGPSRRYA